MNIFKILISGLFVFTFSVMNAQAEERRIEEAIESASLKISLDENNGTGVVYGKICDNCEKLKLIITPDSLAFQGSTQVPLVLR